MKNNIDYTLYLCTDRGLMSTETVEESVELAIKGGCTVVQLREKDCSSLDFYNIALNVKKITDEYNVPLIINDRIDIALAVDAASIVRKIIGNDKIIGVSAATVDEAVRAKNDGADYLGIGAMYATNTKKDTRPVTIETLKEIRKAVNIPLVVIGGINKHTVPDFKGTDIDGIAVISAIIAEKDIEQAARDLLNLYNREVRRK